MSFVTLSKLLFCAKARFSLATLASLISYRVKHDVAEGAPVVLPLLRVEVGHAVFGELLLVLEGSPANVTLAAQGVTGSNYLGQGGSAMVKVSNISAEAIF